MVLMEKLLKMGTIQDKINLIEDTKERLRLKLIMLGYEVSTAVPFRQYPDVLQHYIDNLESPVTMREIKITEVLRIKEYLNPIISLLETDFYDILQIQELMKIHSAPEIDLILEDNLHLLEALESFIKQADFDIEINEIINLTEIRSIFNMLIKEYNYLDTLASIDIPSSRTVHYIPTSRQTERMKMSDINDVNNITNKIYTKDNIGISEVLKSILRLPDHKVEIDETYKNGAQSLSIGESASAFIKNKKEKVMDKVNIKGTIEVELIDKDTGIIKQKQTVNNTITEAYKSWVLYTMMNTAPFGAVSRLAAATNVPIAPQTIGTLGIYVMDNNITVKPKTFIPEYLTKRVSVTPPTGDAGISNVSFYNIAGSLAESTKEMVPVDTGCFLNTAKNEYQIQYTKNTGQGTVGSVIIGRSHRIITGTVNQYSVFTKDTLYNPDIYNAVNLAPYAIEQTNNGTVIYKQKATGADGVISINLKTKVYDIAAPATSMFNNINTLFGGHIANNTLFNIRSLGAISGKNRTTVLTYIRDWKNLEVAKTLTLTFQTRADIPAFLPLACNNMPVIVKKDENTIEIFMTVSVGNHDNGGGGYVNGANVVKAVIDISDVTQRDLTSEDVTYVDCGVIPQVIGYLNVADASNVIGTFVQGNYFGGKYYLPISGICNGGTTNVAASINNSVIAAYQEGAIFNNTLDNLEDYYCVRNVGGYNLLPIETENGFDQMAVNVAGPLLFYTGSQVISGAALEVPITKTQDDILRVTYKYSLSDVVQE
jgi:hypothetical protein